MIASVLLAVFLFLTCLASGLVAWGSALFGIVGGLICYGVGKGEDEAGSGGRPGERL